MTPSRAARSTPGSRSHPAIFAVAERFKLDGAAALVGIAVGAEVACRPQHGGAARGAQGRLSIRPRCSARSAPRPASAPPLKLPPRHLVDAMGIAGSMASGIIEYLADGSWTKRLHPGWAAQGRHPRRAAGAPRAFRDPARCSRARHGLFNGFARTTTGRLHAADRRLRHDVARRDHRVPSRSPAGP